MLARLRSYHRLNETVFLAVFSAICLGLSIFRLSVSHSRMFLFLNWNLFLAFIPWALSSIVILYPKIQTKKRSILALLGAWLLFFPNAPYILTDLYHLRITTSMPVWFDLILILCFAWAGLMFGFMSLWDIEGILPNFINKKWVPIVTSVLLFLGSFGIYMGRFLRWNSWDIIQQPMAILYDVGDRFVNPFQHPKTWGVTLLMWLFLSLVYWSFKLIRTRKM